MNNNTLGEALKRQRISKGLTLTQLSLESEVSITHLSRIEMGKRSPSGHILRKLAGPLGFGEKELLKLAGYLSDDSDERLARFKEEFKKEVLLVLTNLLKKIDSL